MELAGMIAFGVLCMLIGVALGVTYESDAHARRERERERERAAKGCEDCYCAVCESYDCRPMRKASEVNA
jgi:hypothetical protein